MAKDYGGKSNTNPVVNRSIQGVAEDFNDIATDIEALELNVPDLNISDNAIVIGDGGAKKTQGSSVTLTDDNVISALKAIGLDITNSDSPTEGQFNWNKDDGTIQIGMPGGNVALQIGQEMQLPRRADNNSGTNIKNGNLVYISGGSGNNFEVTLADQSEYSNALKTIAMATEDIDDSAKGFCSTYGLVRGSATQPINTNAFNPGDTLYLGNSGLFTGTKPVPPNAPIEVGTVFRKHLTDGAIYVKIKHCKIETTRDITQEPTGFTSPESVIVTYDETTRKVTLTGTVNAYFKGMPVSALISGWVSDAHPATLDKPYFLVYNGTAFEWLDLSVVSGNFAYLLIAYVNYGTTDKFGLRECHGLMQWQSHQELHETTCTAS